MKLTITASLAGLTCLAASVFAAQVQPGAGAAQPGRLIIAPQPIPVRVARADLVATGKVTKIEDKTVSVAPVPGAANKVEYQIAVVKIDDPILNAKGVKEVRVGFIPPPAAGAPPIIRPGGARPVTLVEDEEGLFFLTKHAEGDFYTIPQYFDIAKKANNADYEKEVEEAKKAGTLLADPMAALKAKDAEDRFLTAAMLLERYRAPKPPFMNPPKQEPIDAAESKLILEALRDADWAPPAQPRPGIHLTPLTVFYRLGLTKEDKWNAPQPGVAFNPADAAKEWLKDNAGTYRIKKFVAKTKEEKKDK